MHTLLEVAPRTYDHEPAVHETQPLSDEAPSPKVDHVPAGQLVHVVRPLIAEYVPATQLMHDDAPTCDDHIPAEQFEQEEDPSSE